MLEQELEDCGCEYQSSLICDLIEQQGIKDSGVEVVIGARSSFNLLLFGGVVLSLLFVLLFFVFFFKLDKKKKKLKKGTLGIYFHIPNITIFQIVRYIKNRCGKFR